MNEDVLLFSDVIQRCVDGGQLRVDAPEAAAVQIMSLIDGLSVQAAMGDAFDYTDVRSFVTIVVGQVLGIRLDE